MSVFREPFAPLLLGLLILSPAGLYPAGAEGPGTVRCRLLDPPCGHSAGDAVTVQVEAAGLERVRLVKLLFGWSPPDAVAAVSGVATGLAARHAFLVPGPALIEGATAELGMAAFGAGMSGQGAIAQVRFLLAGPEGSPRPVDLWLQRVELGRSFTERDTLFPAGSVVLVDYCDPQGDPLPSGVFLRTLRPAPSFSSLSRAAVADGSPGEVSVEARLLGGSDPEAVRLRFRLHHDSDARIRLLAPSPRWIPGGSTVQRWVPVDRRGLATLRLDAAAPAAAGAATMEVEVCGETTQGERCADTELRWRAAATAVTASEPAPAPARSRLLACYPNPFNGGLRIPLQIAEGTGPIRVEVWDILGRRVTRLFSGTLPPGPRVLRWDGRDGRGRPVASGPYRIRLRQGSRVQSRTVTLVR